MDCKSTSPATIETKYIERLPPQSLVQRTKSSLFSIDPEIPTCVLYYNAADSVRFRTAEFIGTMNISPPASPFSPCNSTWNGGSLGDASCIRKVKNPDIAQIEHALAVQLALNLRTTSHSAARLGSGMRTILRIPDICLKVTKPRRY